MRKRETGKKWEGRREGGMVMGSAVVGREPFGDTECIVDGVGHPRVTHQVGSVGALGGVLVQALCDKVAEPRAEHGRVGLRRRVVDDSLHHLKVHRHGRVGKLAKRAAKGKNSTNIDM